MRTLLHLLPLVLALILCGLGENVRFASPCDTVSISDCAERETLDDAALWEREASGPVVAQAQSPTVLSFSQGERTNTITGGKPSRTTTAACRRSATQAALADTGHRTTRRLKAPHQFVFACHYYVFALRHIIC